MTRKISLILAVSLAVVIVAMQGGCGEQDLLINNVLVADSTWTVPCPSETVWVPSPPETLYIAPNMECVEECVALNGLGHWRDCLAVCVEAQDGEAGDQPR